MVYHHKPECLVRKVDCCVLGQGYIEVSKYWWMFALTIFSEPLNLLLPNSGMVRHHHTLESQEKRLVCCLRNQGHREGFKNQDRAFFYIFWISDPLLFFSFFLFIFFYLFWIFATKLSLMVQHDTLEHLAKRLDFCVQDQRYNTDSEFECLSREYLLNGWNFCSRNWYCDASSWARVSWKKMVCCLQSQSRS